MSLEDRLIAKFCPPLDEALVIALARDGENEDAALQVLSQLAGYGAPCESQPRDLAFLAMSFPRQKRHTIEYTLRECGGDIQKATDELLNREALDIEFRTADGHLLAFDELAVPDDIHFLRKKKRKARRGQLNVGFVQLSTRDIHKTSWLTIQENADWISNEFQIPRETALSALHAHTSVNQAINVLFGKVQNIKLPTPYITQAALDIHTKYPKVSQERLEQLLVASKGDIDTSTKLVKLLHDKLDPPQVLCKPLPPKFATDSTESAAMVAAARPAACQDKVDFYTQKRNECFAKAAETFRKSGPLFKTAAAAYSDQGKEYDLKAKVWSAKAREAILDNASKKPYELDLHGLTITEALQLTRTKCNDWWSRVKVASDLKTVFDPLLIIVGSGTRSQDGIAKIPSVTRRLLDREGWKYEESPGALYSYLFYSDVDVFSGSRHFIMFSYMKKRD
ncbi:Smr domain-containing protein [Neolecta irregularis DAH-3]|uniref:Smr domain-containing protein n=1 Tax=Neolecta irregularis (strain DAH-3) TaxID=1198029 RepID=A0A1U7LVQ2_NEOID|nr:Smr domain-containing protein [Neolecta irregularis DAH-3]|eukprot:OLL26756.1 Smr domain-containing protein [Neolecta irregularis DAH-3]